jgi:hypothetical protein
MEIFLRAVCQTKDCDAYQRVIKSYEMPEIELNRFMNAGVPSDGVCKMCKQLGRFAEISYGKVVSLDNLRILR